MKRIELDDLVEKKELPYSIFNENGEKIFDVGEVLTPGKLLQLRYFSAIYMDENEDLTRTKKQEIEEKTEEPYDISTIEEPEKEDEISEKQYWEEFFKEDLTTNKISVMESHEQINVKKLYQNAISSFVLDESNDTEAFLDARDRIVEVVLPVIDNIVYRSQLKVMGDYDQTHSVNVAVLSVVLSTKLKLRDIIINDIALAALLHDIGKTKIDKNILVKNNLSSKEQKILQLHPQIGYKIMKKDLGLPEHICRAVLEHHENNDGSGYPYGLSGDLISLPGQIINICNFYENLISGRIRPGIRNSKEALKIILEVGSKNFNSQILYTFINMSSYNDTIPFKEIEG